MLVNFCHNRYLRNLIKCVDCEARLCIEIMLVIVMFQELDFDFQSA